MAAPDAAKRGAFVRGADGLVAAAPAPARWWTALNDATLDALEERALAANPDLDVAVARLRRARAALREQKGAGLPSASASALYAHAHVPGLNLGNSDDSSGNSGGDSDFNIYNLGINASWEIDLFGGQRRAVEAARANAEVAAANIADAQVSVTAAVAQAYVNVRDTQQRIALNVQAIDRQARMLALTRQRYAAGTASRLDVERLSGRLDDVRSGAIPLRAQLDAFRDGLAVLTGQEPGSLDALLADAAPVPLPPAQIAIGDPQALLARRPDIRAAERALAADTAKIGQAQAARYPHISFMGIIGIGGSNPADLTKLDDFLALLAPQLSWSFLDFGRNAAKVQEAESVRDEAEAQYRKAVLGALQDAEASLSRFGGDRQVVATVARARQSAALAAVLFRQRYEAGTATLIDLLDAERQDIQAEQNLSIATARLTGDFIAIQKALGTGWQATGVHP